MIATSALDPTKIQHTEERRSVQANARDITLASAQPIARHEVAGLGPYLQGALMERLSRDLASELHGLRFNPYSQAVTGLGNGPQVTTCSWRIATVGSELTAHLRRAISPGDAVDLRQPGLTLTVVSATDSDQASSADFSRLFYSSDPPRRLRLSFLTPTAFRARGEYHFLPDARLIVQSLALKHSALTAGEEPDEGLIDELARCVRVSSYRAASHLFPIGSQRIPGFTGMVTLGMRGAPTLRAYVAMIARFGEFVGVGIKASMGMGALRAEPATQPSSKDSQ